ncbi:MAG: ATP synthase subunit I [Deltaproteobacteria bacterium]|nr:ATP synthase subunit I [Deltaproteobacteria bacterium]
MTAATPDAGAPGMPAFIAGALRVETALVLVAAVLCHLLGAEPPMVAGVAVGGVVGVVNFFAMAWLGGRLIRARGQSRGVYAVIFLTKMTLVLGVIWLLLTLLPLSPLGFLLGVGLFFPAVMLMLLWSTLAPAVPSTSREHA